MELYQTVAVIFTSLVLLGLTLYAYNPSDESPRWGSDGVNPRFQKPSSKRRVFSECGRIDLSAIGCTVCVSVVSKIKDLVSHGSTQDEVVKIVVDLCILLQEEDKRVCESITTEFKDELFGVAQRLSLSPEEACGMLIGDNCGYVQMWNVSIPGNKPPVIPPRPPKPGSPKIRLLHLTDIHLDSEYLAGSNAECGEPLCCRKGDQNPPPKGKLAAGRWGTHAACDTPFLTVQNLFQHLASIKDQFDYVLFTGDLPAHNIWKQSRDDQLTALATYTDLFTKYLPDKKVYNTLGNHESAPVNSFPPDYITGNQSMSWLYNAIAKSWGRWLPNDTLSTIRSGGYYTVLIKPGFRLISLNVNYCNPGNWWLLINATDPNGELKWLISVLQHAEYNREKVHIIGHIFPGGDCLKAWSWNYYKIINRYESTIAGQFFGHSHSDFYNVFYDTVNFTRPLSTLYIPGSITTFSNLNPGYRIYELDGFYNGSSWAALDFDNYFLNLTEVNVSNKPIWRHQYNAKTAYKLNNLFPADWNDLIFRMLKDDSLFQQFKNHYTKMADTTPCTGDCKKNMLCQLLTGRSHDPNLCKRLGM